MFQASADDSGRILTVSYSHDVGVEEVQQCLGTIRDLLQKMQPGFVLLTDMSSLDSMDTACAPYVAEIMDLCNARGVKAVVRVIPDPRKDIGFLLLSRFHYNPEVEVKTFDNLAAAIESLAG
jgi:hypothetical protein